MNFSFAQAGYRTFSFIQKILSASICVHPSPSRPFCLQKKPNYPSALRFKPTNPFYRGTLLPRQTVDAAGTRKGCSTLKEGEELPEEPSSHCPVWRGGTGGERQPPSWGQHNALSLSSSRRVIRERFSKHSCLRYSKAAARSL